MDWLSSMRNLSNREATLMLVIGLLIAAVIGLSIGLYYTNNSIDRTLGLVESLARSDAMSVEIDNAQNGLIEDLQGRLFDAEAKIVQLEYQLYGSGGGSKGSEPQLQTTVLCGK